MTDPFRNPEAPASSIRGGAYIALYPAQASINIEDAVMRIGIRGEEEGSIGNLLDAP